jgi:UDP-3-O-[3-hydroxymyristoyl] glucosamine N-acyltransferase
MKLFTVEEITSLVSGEQIGSCKDKIYAPEQIENAEVGNITFIGHSKYSH